MDSWFFDVSYKFVLLSTANSRRPASKELTESSVPYPIASEQGEMAVAKSMLLVFLAIVASSVGEAVHFANDEMQQADKSSLNNGIPDVFPCKGPSRYSLEEANTRMLCGGRLCLVHCKAGYKSLTKIPFVYVCHGDGFWTSIPFDKAVKGYSIEWPMCFHSSGF